MKPIIVSGHAFDRIHERGITRTEVESTIRTPNLKEPAKRGRVRVSKKFAHRKLSVFYKEAPAAIIFVTAYWDKEK